MGVNWGSWDWIRGVSVFTYIWIGTGAFCWIIMLFLETDGWMVVLGWDEYQRQEVKKGIRCRRQFR